MDKDIEDSLMRFRVSVRVLATITLLSVSLSGNPIRTAGLATSQTDAILKSTGRIVAIGDIHGAYDEFVSILQELRLIDSDLNWSGGKTHLVQTGDRIDRGSDDRKVLDLVMRLEKQAEKAGGRVHLLTGNHEAMNVIGDLRYVTRESFAQYATPKSDELREKTFTRYLRYRQRRADRSGPSERFNPDDVFKSDWMSKHPPGYLEHRMAFSQEGVYGKWIASRNAVVSLNGIVFVHGGISEEISKLGIRGINERIRTEFRAYFGAKRLLVENGILDDFLDYEESARQVAAEIAFMSTRPGALEPQVAAALEQFASVGNWMISHPAGPLWYRGYAQQSEETFGPVIEQIKRNLGAAVLVVGHTAFSNGIAERFNAGVFLIDTGILRRYYDGRCSALVIEDGKFSKLYPTTGSCG